MPLFHGQRPILGLRFGGFAYLTDCNRIPDASWPLLEGLDVLVIDALRDRPHPTHFSLDEADRRQPPHRRRADALHAHVSRSSARGHQRAPARRDGAGL